MRRAALGESVSSRLSVALEEAVELLARGDAIDADVDERRAGLDHLRSDEAGAADGGDQNVGLAGDRRQVARFGVANRHRRVLVQQQHGRGLAHDVAAAHDHRMLAGDGNVAALENLNDARRGAGRQRRPAGLQAARVDGMKAVDIFLRSDGVEQGFGVDLRRQRQAG